MKETDVDADLKKFKKSIDVVKTFCSHAVVTVDDVGKTEFKSLKQLLTFATRNQVTVKFSQRGDNRR